MDKLDFDIALFIKQNNKNFFSKNILDMFECKTEKIEDLIFSIDKIKNFIQSNEKELSFTETLNINDKNKKLYFKLYKNSNNIYIVIINYTKIHNYSIITNTLTRLIQLIHIKEEKRLFKQTINLILNYAEFAAAFIMINKNNKLVPVTWGNTSEDNLECIKNIIIPLDTKNPALNTPIAKAYLKGKIFINNNTKINPDVEVLRNEMLKRNYLSSVGIPIFKNGKPYGAICICHNEIDFFGKFEKLLKEISKVISYILDEIEKNKFTNFIKKAIDISHEWVVIMDKNGNILYVNDTVVRNSIYSKKDLIGKNVKEFLKDEFEILQYKLKGNKIYEDIIKYKTTTNKEIFLLSNIIVYKNYVIFIGKDITNEKKYKKLLEETKKKDPLTGFLTKEAFLEKTKQIINKYPDNMHIFIVLDIHNFNYFNIEYGKEIGDLLLIKISKDINNLFNQFPEKIIAKNDDDFLIFIPNIENEDLIKIIKIIKKFFNKKYYINKLPLIINSHVGIAIYPRDEKNSEKLLEFAYIALKKSKEEGVNTYKFYNDELLSHIKNQKKALSLIEEAVTNNYFVLFYQPRVEVNTQKIIGAEALIRIKKENKIIPPFEFIKELEQSYHIQQIDLNLLNKIDEIISKTNLNISFNLSLKSFKDNKVINRILEVGKKHPNKLEIELIERSLIEDTDYSLNMLSEFKKHNILIAIDDFGTGYSSLSYLIQFPIDILKIDRSFIINMLMNKASFEIVKATINLSKELNIKTVAEGVETKEQFLILKTLGCDYIQGFYFYKPMSEEEFLDLIKNQ